MARTATYQKLSIPEGFKTYETKVSRDGVEANVTVPDIQNLEDAAKLFGGNMGPSPESKDSEGNVESKPASVIDFLNDAVEAYFKRQVFATLIPINDKAASMVKKMVAGGFDIDEAVDIVCAKLNADKVKVKEKATAK